MKAVGRVKETKVHPLDLQHYPGMYIAVFLAAGLMVEYPLAWTTRGRAIVRRHVYEKGGYDGIAVFETACSMLPWAEQPRTNRENPFADAPVDYAKTRQKLRRLTGDASDKEAID